MRPNRQETRPLLGALTGLRFVKCTRIGLLRHNMDFSRLEKAAIEAILSKPVDGMEIARAQFAVASVMQRDYTGVGFYTTISVPSSVPPLPESRELHDALRDGAGGLPKSDPEGWLLFMLRTDAGYLACLEGWTVRDSWPNEDDTDRIVPMGFRKDKRE